MARPKNACKLDKDAVVVVHVMQRIEAQHVAERTVCKRHGVAVAVLVRDQFGRHAEVRVDAVLQAAAEIAVHVEGDD
jgi:hypothetical protein